VGNLAGGRLFAPGRGQETRAQRKASPFSHHEPKMLIDCGEKLIPTSFPRSPSIQGGWYAV
jgi:hypothetical protein